MRIVHIISGRLTGGAAKGALSLHKSLIQLGYDSIVLNNYPFFGKKDPTIHSYSIFQFLLTLILFRLERLLSKVLKVNSNNLFSTGLLGSISSKNKLISSADVVHLHWINNFISIKAIGNIDKPIIWTIRDSWPYTGGCHLPLLEGCDHFTLACGKCPVLKSSNTSDLSSYILKSKIDSYPRHMFVVGLSKWITKEASKSKVFRGCDFNTIPNSIDFDSIIYSNSSRFKYLEKIDSPIVLTGSAFNGQYHKGFDLLIESLNQINDADYVLVIFGDTNNCNLSLLKCRYIDLGPIGSFDDLVYLYLLSKVYVSASRSESFGKTIMESISCGTPAVCFDIAGQTELVVNSLTGYKAPAFDTMQLSICIREVISLSADSYSRLSHSCTLYAYKNYSHNVVVNSYKIVYEKAVSCCI